jgi:hypothetical protein
MNLFWDVYWPLLTAAVVVGVVAGAVGFRATAAHQPQTRTLRRRGALTISVGAILILAFGALWHGPVGAGERLANTVDRTSRKALDDWEMTQVQGHIERGPIERTLVLSGPADDFQRSELVRIMDDVPGVANVRWTDMPPPFGLPLLAEAELAGLVCFGLGLLLAYLLELRRRYRAQWSW